MYVLTLFDWRIAFDLIYFRLQSLVVNVPIDRQFCSFRVASDGRRRAPASVQLAKLRRRLCFNILQFHLADKAGCIRWPPTVRLDPLRIGID